MENRRSFTKRVWPFLASLGGASVMILAFFIPSIQDQWDRYQSRRVIEQYEQMGNDFFDEERYQMAEEAYARAYELSENKRLDIEVKRLNAKVNQISSDPNWGSQPPPDIKEVDFQYLLHMRKNLDSEKQRVFILNFYGRFLSSLKRAEEAEKVFKEAIALDSADELAYINLGNLEDQLGKKKEAERFYLKAISLEPENSQAHYNLGLLYLEFDRLHEAEKELGTAVKLDVTDSDAVRQYHVVLDMIEAKPRR